MRIKQQPQCPRCLLHSLIVSMVPAWFIKTTLQQNPNGHLLLRISGIAVILQYHQQHSNAEQYHTACRQYMSLL